MGRTSSSRMWGGSATTAPPPPDKVPTPAPTPNATGPPSPSPTASPTPMPPPPANMVYDNPLKIKPAPKRSDNYFLLLGDWGAPDYHSGSCQGHVAQMMKDYVSKHKDKKCLFVGSVGDNFYDKGLKDDNHWKTQWLDRYGTNDPSSSLHNIP